ncbi:DNA-binding FadR family transcriptional regulator [Streptomyces ambofaciens]
MQAVEARDPVAAADAVLALIEAAEQEIAQSPGSPGATGDGV